VGTTILLVNSPEDIDCDLGYRRILHVNPNKVIQFLCLGHNLLKVCQAQVGIDIKAHLGQLQRYIGINPTSIYGFEELQILVNRLSGLSSVAYALPQVVKGHPDPRLIQGPGRINGILKVLTSNEPGRAQ